MGKHNRLMVEITRLTDEVSGMTGLEVVKVKYFRQHGRRILRVTIDKEGGVTIGDCEVFSRTLERLLDEEDLIHERYFLEVESPGI